jgi:hypothetical protein
VAEGSLENVDRRLTETHDPIEVDSSKARSQTAVTDVSGIEAVVTPPKALIRALEGRQDAACGQAFQLVWQNGPWKGKPVTGYCAEPLCITEGACTGTRFVPHVDQWTSTDVNFRVRRKMGPKEVIAASRQFAHMAAAQTGRDEERTDAAILDHVKMVWRKTIEHIRGQGGQWRRS